MGGSRTVLMEAFANVMVRACVVMVRIYQVTLSSWFGPSCRFEPSCSEYAVGAFKTHGVLRGGWLVMRRLGRCHPMGGDGFDPVPERGISGP